MNQKRTIKKAPLNSKPMNDKTTLTRMKVGFKNKIIQQLASINGSISGLFLKMNNDLIRILEIATFLIILQ